MTAVPGPLDSAVAPQPSIGRNAAANATNDQNAVNNRNTTVEKSAANQRTSANDRGETDANTGTSPSVGPIPPIQSPGATPSQAAAAVAAAGPNSARMPAGKLQPARAFQWGFGRSGDARGVVAVRCCAGRVGRDVIDQHRLERAPWIGNGDRRGARGIRHLGRGRPAASVRQPRGRVQRREEQRRDRVAIQRPAGSQADHADEPEAHDPGRRAVPARRRISPDEARGGGFRHQHDHRRRSAPEPDERGPGARHPARGHGRKLVAGRDAVGRRSSPGTMLAHGPQRRRQGASLFSGRVLLQRQGGARRQLDDARPLGAPRPAGFDRAAGLRRARAGRVRPHGRHAALQPGLGKRAVGHQRAVAAGRRRVDESAAWRADSTRSASRDGARARRLVQDRRQLRTRPIFWTPRSSASTASCWAGRTRR